VVSHRLGRRGDVARPRPRLLHPPHDLVREAADGHEAVVTVDGRVPAAGADHGLGEAEEVPLGERLRPDAEDVHRDQEGGVHAVRVRLHRLDAEGGVPPVRGGRLVEAGGVHEGDLRLVAEEGPQRIPAVPPRLRVRGAVRVDDVQLQDAICGIRTRVASLAHQLMREECL